MTSTRLTNEQTNVTSSVTGGRPPLTMQSVRDPANVVDLMIVPDMSGAHLGMEAN
jgi:hypothetical protein